MNDGAGIKAVFFKDTFTGGKTERFVNRRKRFLLLIAVPLLAMYVFSFTAFKYGTPGFRVDKTGQGLRISKVLSGENPVEVGDVIIAINGLQYSRVLGLLLLDPANKTISPSITLLRDKQVFTFIPVFKPTTWPVYLSVAWPHLLLILLFLCLGTVALLRAPPGQPATLFFFMLCSFSTTIATTLPSHFGLLQPKIISLSFLGIALSNWFAFGAFAHFNCRFPKERDLFHKKPLCAVMLYLVPMAVGLGSALVLAGLSEDFFTALQRSRNFCVPLLLIGSFAKHAIDLRYLSSPSAKNQVKLILFAYWPTYAPYLILYLLPGLLFDRPLISFRVVLLAATILPTAHLIALLRYNLLGVDRLINRTIAYFIVILLLTIIYVSLLALIKWWIFGRQIFSEELFLFFLLTVALGITPFINWTQKMVDRYFFRFRHDDDIVLHGFSQKLAATLKFSELITLINDELPQQMHITRSAVLLIEKNHSRLFPEDVSIGNLSWSNSKLIQQFNSGKQAFFCLEEHIDPELSQELLELSYAGYHLVLPLQGGHTLSGALLLGSPKDGRLFRNHDIRMMGTLANQVAVALNNSLHYTSLAKSKKQLETLFEKVVQAKKMAALGEMTATLAHEIKNPLGIIRSSAQYLAETERNADINQEMLGYIIDEVDGLNAVVTNILGLAKFKKPDIRAITLQKEIPKLCQQWNHSDDHNSDIKIQCSVAGDLPPLYVDFRQLRQVLLNLILNSEEALKNDGIIILSVRQENDFAVFQLQDDGPGIAEEHIDELFKNFFTTKSDGLGIGLAVCKQIISAHHGFITISNLPENGVEVLIYLPFRPAEMVFLEDIHSDEVV